jgi:predicted CXXCH cytochrome family protein
MRKFLVAVSLWLGLAAAQEQGKILRPVDGAALPAGKELSIVAQGAGGKLEIDGKPVPADQPFPEVLHAKTKPAPGPHVLALISEGGRQEIRFFVGGDPPAGFKTFRQHPPLAVECAQCHGLSARGRFRFKGGCFDCHKEEAFSKTHTHKSEVLVECGQCHNAHGSTEKALLLMPREKACKLCHN